MPRVERKDRRQSASAPGYLYSTDGWPLGECQLVDVSKTGAKLVHEIEDEMPAQFMLSFSRNGKVRRQCQTVWKKENEIGVRFVADT
jgi:PilZ domain